uniref:Uncharacterized protein n=1 Tax=Ixodes ricinus TaxID=34613 RepID=A0A6B0UTD7_IXORI
MDLGTETVTSKRKAKLRLDDLIDAKLSEYHSLQELAGGTDGRLPPSRRVQLKQRRHELALAYNDRGHIHYRLIEFDEAVDDYTEALKYNDCLAAAYYNRGTVHYRMGCFSTALLDMEKAVSLDPNNKEFFKGLEETKRQL